MRDMNDVDLLADPTALIAVKKPIPVPVRFATEAGIVTTREGPVAFAAGAAICRGVDGEEWPVPRPRFDAMYEPLPGTESGRSGMYQKKPLEVRAKQVTDGEFFVNVGATHQPIFGKIGDWLVQYSPEKRAVIGDKVFRASYDLLPQ
jgi:PGDYG protein